ncbi:uncharacterized protein LOC125665775 [Ostrea edulis]|uniref:uncharacterized protein LOC125665775 n=1 Tax=Ostrea edulis TaxID=37623 RepID=UPI00209603ED|nr:uncharacterized protein LOC125665775 [Ostrea edulis]
MATNGLHFLVDPVAEDVKVVCHLLNYLQNVKDSHHNNDEFLVATYNFLQCMEQYYGETRAHTVSNWMLFLRQLLTIISETLYIKLSCRVCEVAVETSVTVPCRIRTNLNNAVLRLNNICGIVGLLQREASEICDNQRRGSENGQQHVALWDEDMVALIMQSRQVQDLLQGCEVLMSPVVETIEGKIQKDQRFFNTMSLSIGAVCLGNFAWNVWQGRPTEQLISTGMWSLCTGFSAAVLQIPRVRLTDISSQLQQHRKAREKVKEVTHCWMDSDKLSYAKLVRPPSKRENSDAAGFLIGKAASVETNCR